MVCGRLCYTLVSVFDEAGDFGVGGEVGASVEGGKFDDEVDVDFFGFMLFTRL